MELEWQIESLCYGLVGDVVVAVDEVESAKV